MKFGSTLFSIVMFNYWNWKSKKKKKNTIPYIFMSYKIMDTTFD